MCRAEHKMQYPRSDPGRLRYFRIYRECIHRGRGRINLSPRKEKLLVVQIEKKGTLEELMMYVSEIASVRSPELHVWMKSKRKY